MVNGRPQPPCAIRSRNTAEYGDLCECPRLITGGDQGRRCGGNSLFDIQTALREEFRAECEAGKPAMDRSAAQP